MGFLKDIECISCDKIYEEDIFPENWKETKQEAEEEGWEIEGNGEGFIVCPDCRP